MVSVFDDADALAAAAADAVLDAAADAGAGFRLGLSGGETPRRLYGLLAREPRRTALLASRPVILFADERAVPPDDAASNYRLVRQTLLDPCGIAEADVHRMRGEAADLEQAALDYESAVAEPIDLLILGIGPDGHTASIFPGSAAARERQRRVVAVENSPKPPPRRLTITPRVIREAKRILVLATGTDKAEAVAKALDAATDQVQLPARLLRHAHWFLDRAAARFLA